MYLVIILVEWTESKRIEGKKRNDSDNNYGNSNSNNNNNNRSSSSSSSRAAFTINKNINTRIVSSTDSTR